ncbi:MAG: glycosyltransferase family 4 protein [Bacteroidales bacterium]|nr:glycosyltransferase family 4 protein [Bacteroidales bacterium]
MKILYISPSAGDSYYCGNCFRDSLQATALIRAGHDVTVMPLYLPMQLSSEGVPVFFPAVSYYLEQALFRKGNMPAWLGRLTSSKGMLGLASSLSGTTSSAGMEGMTMSMITGEDGAFRRHMEEMVRWMRKDGLPDVIHLSSSLLIGIAGYLKAELGIPVVCSLQDEEVWIDGLKDAWAEAAWKAIEDAAVHVDAFVTTSRYYRDVVRSRLRGIEPRVIEPGVEIARYRDDVLPAEPTVGFFYRMNGLDGLDVLADAFVLLKRRGTVPGLKLRIGGGAIGPDRKLVSKVRATLRPYAEDVLFEEHYSPAGHAAFYRKVTVLSVPLQFDEGVGLYVCEAFAAGRPVVEPRRGSFPEVVGDGGILYEPFGPGPLADALERLLTDRAEYDARRQAAMALARERYASGRCASLLEALYKEIILNNLTITQK